eukprot:1250991-Prymnesium_polylepis.1
MSHAVKGTACCTPTVVLRSCAATLADGTQRSGSVTRPHVTKLVRASTVSATSSFSVVATASMDERMAPLASAAMDERTLIESVSTYTAPLARADRRPRGRAGFVPGLARQRCC